MPHAASLRFGLACSLSLLLHAGLAALLLTASLRRTVGDERPLPADAVAFDEAGEPMPLTVLPLPAPATLAPVVPEVAAPLARVPVTASAGTAILPTVASTGGTGLSSATITVAPAFFQVPVRGRSVVYVLDRSLSMDANGHLAPVKRELLASLNQLPPTSRFQVIFYNGQTDTLQPGEHALIPATDRNKRLAAQRIESLMGEGGTRHLAALQLALALEPEVVYFLTDADDLTPAVVLEITRLNRGRAVIHTLEMTAARRDGAGPLKALAQRNRGEYRALAPR